MTYYINPIWFYLMNVCENIDTLSFFIAFIFGVGTIITNVAIISNKIDGDNEMVNLLTKYVKPFTVIAVIFIFLACVIPSKETCEEMMIASVVTHENVQQTKDDVKSIVDYVFDRIESNDSEE